MAGSERYTHEKSDSDKEISALESIHGALLELGPDHKANEAKLLKLCGKLTGALFVIYSRYDNNQLNTIGKYIASKDIDDVDFTTCPICKKIITDNLSEETIITNLQDTIYAESDCFIKWYKLKTYIGKAINSEGELLGALCLFYDRDFVPDPYCIRVMSIIGSLLGNEDKRIRDQSIQESDNLKIRDLMEASSEASQVLISNINFDDALNKVIDIIASSTKQDRIYIYEFIRNGSSTHLRQRLERLGTGISSHSNIPGLSSIEEKRLTEKWHSIMSKGEPVMSYVDALDHTEREILEKAGILSILVVPIFVDGVCWGIIGFDNCKTRYDWSDTEANILLNIASALGLYMFRTFQRLELIAAKEQAEESEVYANAFFDQSPTSIQLISTNGTTEKVNKAFDALFCFPREKVIDKFNLLTDPRSKSMGWDKTLNQILEDGNGFMSEIIFDPGYFNYSGEKRYLSITSFPIRFKGRIKKVAVMFQDITNLKNYEREQERQKHELIEISNIIKENELKYRTILENSFNLICQLSLDGKFIYYNRAYKEVLGYNQTELLETSGYDLFHPDELSRIKLALFNHLMRNNEVKFVARVRTKSGEYKLIDHKFKLLQGENEKDETILLSAQDITEMNRNEMLLQMQRNLAYSIISCKSFEEFYSVINNEISSVIPVNNMYVAFYDEKTGMLSLGGKTDEKDDIEVWAAEGSMTGYTLKLNKPVFATKQDMLHLYETGKIQLVGVMSEVWLGVPFRSEVGITGAIVLQNYDNPNALSHADIEVLELVANEICIFLDKKNAEESTLKLTKAVTESPASVIITNVAGDIEYVNPKFTSITGYTYEEVIGMNPRILKSGTTSDYQYKNLWETICSGNEWRGEIKNKKKNGEFFWEDISISPILDEKGKISHYVAVKEDITDRKRLINQLIEARDKAEESDRLKTSFLQNISHEIRTPMNGIMGFLGLLREPDATGDEKKLYFDIIEKSSQRMLSTINDIIDISKIEAGVVSIKNSTISVNQIVSDVVTFFRPEVEKKNMKIFLNLDSSVQKLTVNSDYEKIYATLTNLIKNAIKYSIKGEINVNVIREENFVVFCVKDTGIGIPKDKLDKVFERFIQAESETIRTYEGAGLGLSIGKAYIELLGGEIHVESELGVGSEFTFTIPLDTPEQEDQYSEGFTKTNSSTRIADKIKPLKILIAEDEETNALYLKAILRQFKYDLLFARNGREAVEIYKSNRDIKLILMDIRMPEMDGIQATKLIKKLDPQIVIIAQTAYAFTGDKEKALASGFDDYLAKPIAKKDLFDMITKHTPA